MAAKDPLPAGIVNALVFGTDARKDGSFGGNADVVMLAQLSADRKHLTLVSIARDTYLSGRKATAAFPHGGVAELSRVVSAAFGGLTIHAVAQTNFGGFIAISKAMNGIRVVNKHASTVTSSVTGHVFRFTKGDLHLDGADALVYARQRKGLPQGDLDRAERHRALIVGLIRGLQGVARTSPTAFAPLAKKIAASCRLTGIKPDSVPGLLGPLMQIDPAKVTSLMLPLSGFDTVKGQSVNIVNKARAEELAAGLARGDVSGYVAKYGTGYKPKR